MGRCLGGHTDCVPERGSDEAGVVLLPVRWLLLRSPKLGVRSRGWVRAQRLTAGQFRWALLRTSSWEPQGFQLRKPRHELQIGLCPGAGDLEWEPFVGETGCGRDSRSQIFHVLLCVCHLVVGSRRGVGSPEADTKQGSMASSVLREVEGSRGNRRLHCGQLGLPATEERGQSG